VGPKILDNAVDKKAMTTIATELKILSHRTANDNDNKERKVKCSTGRRWQ